MEKTKQEAINANIKKILDVIKPVQPIVNDLIESLNEVFDYYAITPNDECDFQILEEICSAINTFFFTDSMLKDVIDVLSKKYELED